MKILKRVIGVIGISSIIIVLLFNLFFTARISPSEKVLVELNNIFFMIGPILLAFLIVKISKLIERKINDRFRKWLYRIIIALYILFNILWVIFVRPPIVADQVHVGNFAQAIANETTEDFFGKNSYAGISLKDYTEKYQQQITLAFIYSLLYKVISIDSLELLRTINVIGVLLTFFAIIKISKVLSKDYKISKVRLILIILGFVPLSILSTFVYGDIISLAFSLWSIYFIMKYCIENKIRFAICSAFLMAIAYMARMNILIFIIATAIYLILNLFNVNGVKNKLLKILIIGIYLVISIFPANLVKSYYIYYLGLYLISLESIQCMPQYL